MKVKCKRDGHIFIPKIKKWPGRRERWPGGQPYFNCPKCMRGYFLEQDGKWRSDREIEILED